jgi:hypothetical protein
MKCDQVHEAFLDYFDHILDGNQKLRIEEHLSNCKNCKEDFEALKVYHSSVKRLKKVQAPSKLKETIILGLNNPKPKLPKNGKTLKLIKYISGIAAAILVLFYFVAPDSYFKPASFEVIYVERIEKSGKGNEKSSTAPNTKAETIKRKIQELGTMVDDFGGSLTQKTINKSTGTSHLLQIKIFKRKYYEFIKQFNELFPHVSLPENVPFTTSRYCIIEIEIK